MYWIYLYLRIQPDITFSTVSTTWLRQKSLHFVDPPTQVIVPQITTLSIILIRYLYVPKGVFYPLLTLKRGNFLLTDGVDFKAEAAA